MVASTRHIAFAAVFVLFFLGVIYSNYKPAHVHPIPTALGIHTAQDGDASLRQVLQFIYNPDAFSETTPTFSHAGKAYKLPSKPAYTAPLGKDVCILDVDTRPFEGPNQIFHDKDFDWEKLEPHSGGVLNHYMYGSCARIASMCDQIG
jgi:hypothetical protein